MWLWSLLLCLGVPEVLDCHATLYLTLSILWTSRLNCSCTRWDTSLFLSSWEAGEPVPTLNSPACPWVLGDSVVLHFRLHGYLVFSPHPSGSGTHPSLLCPRQRLTWEARVRMSWKNAGSHRGRRHMPNNINKKKPSSWCAVEKLQNPKRRKQSPHMKNFQ
jgi:hypothetical protein